ncbi:MAG TPA: PA14 domain-containing protein, partial [Caldilineaceae bacterium]|nr:PA14 domain-containing protein [Caldilineaceae bacterium]
MRSQRGLSALLPRILFTSLLLVLVALLASVLDVDRAQAQGIVTPRHTDPFWQAAYWNNSTMEGTPVLNREERSLDFDWGTGSPDGRVNSDNFSARWTRYIDVPPGEYTFTAISDDGMRVRIDGELVIDAWWDHSPAQFTGTKYLSSGHHLLEVEYYEKSGGAVAKLSWQQGEPPITEWKGAYFNNKSLSGTPVVVRNDNNINFDWGTGSPANGVDRDGFSVRWSQKLNLPAGMHRFRMTVDDGARLFVNGHTLIDAWKLQSATEHTGDIYLPGGSVTVQMEYFEESGNAVARLSWEKVGSGSSPTPTPTPVPPSTSCAVVDNQSAGFVRGG